jgi:hypothetical protein
VRSRIGRRSHLAAPGIARETVSELWRLGQAWRDLVARSWVDVVRDSMAAIKTESERRAQDSLGTW